MTLPWKHGASRSGLRSWYLCTVKQSQQTCGSSNWKYHVLSPHSRTLGMTTQPFNQTRPVPQGESIPSRRAPQWKDHRASVRAVLIRSAHGT